MCFSSQLKLLKFSAHMGKITDPCGPSTLYQARDTCQQWGLKIIGNANVLDSLSSQQISTLYNSFNESTHRP